MEQVPILIYFLIYISNQLSAITKQNNIGWYRLVPYDSNKAKKIVFIVIPYVVAIDYMHELNVKCVPRLPVK